MIYSSKLEGLDLRASKRNTEIKGDKTL